MNIIMEMREEIPIGEKEAFGKLEKVMTVYWRTPFPVSKVYELITEIHWQLSKAKSWKKKVVCTISLCKLHENILKLRLPLLLKKSNLKDIYEYSQRTIKYLNKEASLASAKVICEYRRMGEILMFERCFA
eukprot:TRINITY_DN6008_c0_g1_i13.p1 TRINITY_DN6008_c0_g1~~TRINITY_DN6008_c0_g1_i13.p1  ORF type:complete len:131 (+),score=21.72 TRINITY_DN6008_c0_g1_i13:240-632(+)